MVHAVDIALELGCVRESTSIVADGAIATAIPVVHSGQVSGGTTCEEKWKSRDRGDRELCGLGTMGHGELWERRNR